MTRCVGGQACDPECIAMRAVAEQRIREVLLVLTGLLRFFSVHLVVYLLPWHCILRDIEFHFFFSPHRAACGVLFPHSGIKPVPLQ